MELFGLQDMTLSGTSYAGITSQPHWSGLSADPATLPEQLQTSLDLANQLQIYSMAAGKVLPLRSIQLQTAVGKYLAPGSEDGNFEHRSVLMLNDQCLAELSYQSDQAFTPLIQHQLWQLERQWLYPLRNTLVVVRLQQLALKAFRQLKLRHLSRVDFFLTEQERDQFAPSLREIFPEIRRGCFTQDKTSGLWVWTTFNSFQWDLNYANPAVFNAMAEEMLFLANQGASVLRLDALAFVWKQAGTNCENLPKAHTLIKAFNAVARIAAPALQFKSEAIVHPDEVVKYIAPEECQLSYNPLLMALLWDSLATRKTSLLTASLSKRFAIHPHCSWVNYIRCHDDIGWTFDDNIAWQLGINPDHHRQFLNQFYTGQFEGSFAAGVPFQQNPVTGDCRVAGMLSSLAGVEKAEIDKNPLHLEHALQRIYLLNSVILSIGGLPLLYMGDELGLKNDYSYVLDPAKKDDSRWVNRVAVSEAQLALANKADSLSGRIYQQLQHLIQTRAQLPLLGSGSTEILRDDNPHLFVYQRQLDGKRLVAVVNFSEHLQLCSSLAGQLWFDELTAQKLPAGPLQLLPYQVLWLTPTH